VGVGIVADFAELQGVFVAVVRNDMHVGAAARDLWLDADEARGNVAAIKDPARRVATEDGCDLLLGRKQDQGRLQKTGADDGRRFRVDYHDGARDAWKERVLGVVRFGVADCHDCETGGDVKGRFHGESSGVEWMNRLTVGG
jgi:hypothetical protein